MESVRINSATDVRGRRFSWMTHLFRCRRRAADIKEESCGFSKKGASHCRWVLESRARRADEVALKSNPQLRPGLCHRQPRGIIFLTNYFPILTVSPRVVTLLESIAIILWFMTTFSDPISHILNLIWSTSMLLWTALFSATLVLLSFKIRQVSTKIAELLCFFFFFTPKLSLFSCYACFSRLIAKARIFSGCLLFHFVSFLFWCS